jgi:hypothetical protein
MKKLHSKIMDVIKDENKIITNSAIGCFFTDLEEFNSLVVADKKLYKDPTSYPYNVGKINDIEVWVDPNMSFNDLKMYNADLDLIYDFSAEYSPMDFV